MNLESITPLILTYNEEANLRRALKAVSWARQIVIVDSGSNDDTRQIAEADERVRFHERPFDMHATQWNYGLERVTTEWTLALDADYVCSPALEAELARLKGDQDVYFARFKYCIGGRPLRGTLYPARAVLFRTGRFRYVQDGHTQVLDLSDATIGHLKSRILHDDRKPLRRWLASQATYAALEANKVLSTPRAELGWKDRIRRGILWAPPLTLLYCLVWKRLILDGWPGVYYSLQRTYAELLLSLELLERRLGGKAESAPPLAPPRHGEADGSGRCAEGSANLRGTEKAGSASAEANPLEITAP